MTCTLIVVMPDGFDLSGSTAAHTIRWGYYHGAIQAGLSARFVQYVDLLEVEDGERPIFWLTYDDYRFLNEDVLAMLRSYPHIVEVNVWFEGMEKLHRDYSAPSPAIPEDLLRRILNSEPDFVWCSAPESYLEFYEGWAKVGMKVVSLPWACDVDRYYPSPGERFEDVEMAYVGGYRPYKERQYGIRLWPYNERLRIWGYNEWPRCYQGHLCNEQERELYSQARICPTISEPQFCVTGDTVERPFKIMGCKGLTVLDMPCYAHLFGDDEALVACLPDTYYGWMDELLADDELCEEYRGRGYKAVMERHTYAHRVQKMLEELRL